MIRMRLKGKQSLINARHNYIYFWIALVITIAFGIVWGVNKIYPFEEHSLIIVDGVHQYIPFFSEYYEKIKNGESLLYSFRVGMGNNFLSLFTYYLAAPVNLLVLLFSKEKLYFSMSLLVYLKVLLAGLFFAYYLIHRPEDKKKEETDQTFDLTQRRKKEFYIAGFSLAYALSSYCMGYYWNIMWLDCIYILPLVILGMERLMKEKKIALYVITLAYCLYCNYYMGFMVCLFLVLFFFTFKPSSIKEFVMNGLRFAVSSLLGGGISAVLLLPAYWGIMMTSSGETITSKIPEWKWYGTIKETLVSQLAFHMPITTDPLDGKANLYCSVIVLFLVPMFLLKRKTSWYRKITITALILFFYASYENELLNYIWHGFHNQYGIPNRMVFLCNFLLLMVGYEVTKERKSVPWYGYGFGFLFSVGFIVYLWKENPTAKSAIFIISLVIVFIYVILFCIAKWRKIKNTGFTIVFTILLSVEVTVFGVAGILNCGYSNAEKYNKTEELEAAKLYIKEGLKEDFYRTEFNVSKYLDEATYHNLNCISLFGSTADADTVRTLGKLGFYTATNEHLYRGATQFTDSILGVRYTLKREDDLHLNTFSLVEDFGTVGVYENQYPLSLGFKVSPNIRYFDKGLGTVFEVQNQLAEKMTEEKDPLFTTVTCDSTLELSSNVTTESKGGTHYSFEKSDTKEAFITMQIPIEEDMELYIYPSGTSLSEVVVWLDSDLISSGRLFLQCVYVGKVEAGQLLTVKFKMKANGENSGYVRTRIAQYHPENFETYYNILRENQLSVKQLDANVLECTSQDKEGGLYFTSIPYDDGFEVTVDGEKQDTRILADAFLGFELEPLEEGQEEHKIVIKFVPIGLKEGIIISVSSILIFILILCLKRIQKKEREGTITGKI
ncbi:MAG: YfhO family protein [Lachnospiraceae bacterium]|nr:YfhO family protein [Lachnospiraceae bacterium]